MELLWNTILVLYGVFAIGLIFYIVGREAYRKFRIHRADREYVRQVDLKILGKDFEEILPYCDKQMIRILKLMNRAERREWLKKNSNEIKKLKNG
jgi:hypothetical protein